MKIEIDRRDVCALMLACTCCDLWAADGNTKWMDLHDKLAEQLIKYDEKHAKEA